MALLYKRRAVCPSPYYRGRPRQRKLAFSKTGSFTSGVLAVAGLPKTSVSIPYAYYPGATRDDFTQLTGRTVYTGTLTSHASNGTIAPTGLPIGTGLALMSWSGHTWLQEVTVA